jgi:hypothetical protein
LSHVGYLARPCLLLIATRLAYGQPVAVYKRQDRGKWQARIVGANGRAVAKQAGQPAGAGRSRDRRNLLRHCQAPPAGLRDDAWRRKLATACAAHAALGPTSLVMFDVSTLYFETDTGDGFREPGFSKERRLEPQITIGLLTDASGFPLMVEAFEGHRAETTTMLPTITALMACGCPKL